MTLKTLGPLILVLTFSPFTPLTDFVSPPVAWTAPPSYSLGEVVLVPEVPEVKSVWLSGRPMTWLKRQRQWMGAAPHGQVALQFHFREPRSGSPRSARTQAITEIVVPVTSPPLGEAEDLRLPAAVWKQVKDPTTDQRQKDRETINRVMNDFGGEFTTNCWQLPLKSRITSAFGSPRRLPDGSRYHHLGEDRRAMVGTRIRAAAAGRVAFAGDMVVPGKNVILNHGDGWFTRYMHMSKLEVKTGDDVGPGSQIGLSGATGRVEAPHLHWEIVWRGIHVRPDHFLRAWERLCGPPSA